MKKVKSLSCSSRRGLRNGMKIYVSEMYAVRLVSASSYGHIYIFIYLFIYFRPFGVHVPLTRYAQTSDRLVEVQSSI